MPKAVCNGFDANSHEINVSDENVENSLFLDILPPTFGAMTNCQQYIASSDISALRRRILIEFGVDMETPLGWHSTLHVILQGNSWMVCN